MKRLILSCLTAAALTVGFSASALADDAATIKERKQNQQKRIGEGVENGSLTAKETANLETKEARINRETRRDRAKNGGKLTAAEKARINRQQNRVSKDIYKEKHDAQTQK